MVSSVLYYKCKEEGRGNPYKPQAVILDRAEKSEQIRGQADRPKAKVSGEAGNPFEPAPSTAKVIKRRSV